MHPDAASEKSAFPSSHDEKTLELPTTTVESKGSVRSSLVNPNSRQKRLLAYAAAYATAFVTFKTWQAYQPESRNATADVFTSDGYLNGLSSQGWSFISMRDREEHPTVQSSVAFSQSIEDGKGHHGKHGSHRHGHPPFRHVTPQQAEEIFLKVPSNDSAGA